MHPRSTHPRRATSRSNVRSFVAVCGLVVAFAGCGSTTGTSATDASTTVAAASTTARTPVTHEFVIPEGTDACVRRGEDPEVFPKRLDVHVGDRLVVRNDDTAIARLGIFDVGPGETMAMTFNQVTVLTGVMFATDAGGCGTPPTEDEKFVINVRP